MITPKERLKLIFEGQKVDRPACICPGGMMNMITSDLMERVGVYLPEAHTDPVQMAALAKAVYEEGCFENYGVPFCMTVEAEEMGAKVDLGSRVYEPHVVGYAIDSVVDYKKLRPVDLSCQAYLSERPVDVHLGCQACLSERPVDVHLGTGRARVVLEAIRILKKETSGVPIVGNLTGPVSTASSLMEPVTFYKELRKKKEQAHEYMEFVTEQLIAFGRAQIEAGADVIAISDPSGTGEILGPKHFREFAVTYINKLLDALQEEKLGTIVHICGQMSPVYAEVGEMHSSALSFDSIVPMKEAREHLESRVLMGNVSTYALEFGDPDRVKALTNHCVKSGSDIISPACGLGMKSPIGNVQAILEALKEE
ncbi:methylcobamide:CoM methyltransferase MtbA [Roseburia hominis]